MAKNIQTKHSYTSRSSLNIVDMPTTNEVIDDHDAMKKIASTLYDVNINDILSLKKDKKFDYKDRCFRFKVKIKNKPKKTFYLKTVWNGTPMNEALAMTLSNILLEDSKFHYMISCDGNSEEEGLVITDKFRGKSLIEFSTFEQISLDDFSFGVALEHANALSISDRDHKGNYMVCDNKVYNIDFGFSFEDDTINNPHTELCSLSPSDLEAFANGVKHAQKMIAERFLSNESLIEDIIQEAKDSGNEFIRDPLKHLKKYVNTPIGGLD